MIVDFDIKDIQEKFNRIVKYSQHLDGEVNSDELFEDWRRNKSVFIQRWDGQLIKELGEMTFHLSDDQKAKVVNDVIEKIDEIYQKSGLGYPDFKEDDLIQFILMNQYNFFDNVTIDEYKNRDILVPKGMKILRAFKFFCNDKDLLNDIQSVASMAIQNDKITGTLCMSVHPLDYLSVSENVHNWRSCHALDGEYRAGNLNYMADPTTVVCYLKSNHKYELPRFPEDIKWNSKKWRVLLFFDDTYRFMMAGRQYPYFENSLLLPIKHEVERMFERKFSGWFDQYVTSTTLHSFLDDENESNRYETPYAMKYIPVGQRLLRLKKFVQDEPGTLQFNDLLESTTYEYPYYSFALERNWRGDYYHEPSHVGGSYIPKIRVGKKCTCLECGKEDITMSEAFLCKHCMIKEHQVGDSEEFGICHWCHEPFLWDEGGYLKGQYDESYPTCPSCMEDTGRSCSECGELYHESILDSEGLCPYCARWRNNCDQKNLKPIRATFYDKESGEKVLDWDLISQLDLISPEEIEENETYLQEF